VGVAFVVRTLIVVVTRRRWPAVSEATDRWWTWAPLVAVCAVGIWWFPPIGIPLAIAMAIGLTRAGAIGSPFRPRR
jgi:hypothetical protein